MSAEMYKTAEFDQCGSQNPLVRVAAMALIAQMHSPEMAVSNNLDAQLQGAGIKRSGIQLS